MCGLVKQATNKLIPWTKFILEKSRTPPHYMQPDGSSACQQEAVTVHILRHITSI